MTGAALHIWVLLLVPAAPLLLACALLVWPRERMLITLAPWTALPALIGSVSFAIPLTLDLPWLLLGAQLGLDHTGQTFLFFTGLLWLAAGVFATGSLKADDGRPRFFVFYLLAMAGNIGLIVAQDMVSFYVFFALMSFSSYGLIVHTRSAEARRAGRIYMIMVVASELLLFAAMVMAAQIAGSVLFADVGPALANAATQNLILVLALAGFGIKLGVLGLHVWLPLAHPVAPTPASAVLSGAMIKAGLLGWLRLLPFGAESVPIEWGTLLIGVGALAVFYAAIVGITQQNPKTVLAYSSVSQMGLVTIAIGLGLTLPERWPEISAIVLFLALHHALAKSALFLGVGMATSRLASEPHRWLVAIGLIMPALALAGAPFTGGAVVKVLLSTETAFIDAAWRNTLKTFLSWTVLATVFLMARFLYLAWPRPVPTPHPATATMWLPWGLLILAVLLTPLFASPGTTEKLWSWSTTLSSLGTFAVAAAGTAGGAWIIVRIGAHRLPHPPAGDLVIPVEKAVTHALALIRNAIQFVSRQQHYGARLIQNGWSRLQWPIAPDYAMDLAWTTACLLFLAMALIFIVVAAL